MTKLDLGGGHFPKHDGYINVDIVEGDVVCDVQEGLPFEDNSVERIWSHHLIEHLYENKIPFVLSECYRVLQSKMDELMVMWQKEGIRG